MLMVPHNLQYSFFPNVSPGYKIIENPHNLLYPPIIADTVPSITIWLTDINGNERNLRGENVCVNAISSENDLKNILRKEMTINTKVNVRISESQNDNLKKVFKSNCESITINATFTYLHGENVIAITKSQLDGLVKAYEAKKGMTIKMSRTQMPYIMRIEGGFYQCWLD